VRTAARFVVLAVALALATLSVPSLAQQAPIDWGKYIDHIVDLLEEHSVFRYEIDWTAFRAQVETITKPYNLETESERNEVIRELLALLQERCDLHSLFVPTLEITARQVDWAESQSVSGWGEGFESSYGVSAKMLEGRIAYIAIPRTFSGLGLEVEAIARMAVELVRLIRLLDEEHPAGWAIDLRSDSGGSVMCRLLGFLPFFVDGRLFGYASPTSGGLLEIDDWLSYSSGNFIETTLSRQSGSWESSIIKTDVAQFTLSNPNAPIAVLIGPETASAGEYLAVALAQNPCVCVFGGGPTAGVTTYLSWHTLEDGSLLGVASKYMVDPSGTIHGIALRQVSPWYTAIAPECTTDPIVPDVVIDVPRGETYRQYDPRLAMMQELLEMYRRYGWELSPYLVEYFKDTLLDAALAWLREQAAE